MVWVCFDLVPSFHFGGVVPALELEPVNGQRSAKGANPFFLYNDGTRYPNRKELYLEVSSADLHVWNIFADPIDEGMRIFPMSEGQYPPVWKEWNKRSTGNDRRA